MKRIILAMAGALTFACPALAQDTFYGGISLGIADYSFADSEGIVTVATVGLALPQLGEKFAIEGEMTRTLWRPDTAQFGGISYTTAGGYGVHALGIGPKLDLRTRIGMTYKRVDFGDEIADSSLSGSLSLGLAYELQDGLRLVADHTLIGTDITNTSIGLQYRF
ncbi:outer membrane beta-barrel protein [Ectothiorhodospiraceae bacterium 2226]|nr:outer membrane beta-barrel protein [Ectothiorhodospiraceae bacterium 2226]